MKGGGEGGREGVGWGGVGGEGKKVEGGCVGVREGEGGCRKGSGEGGVWGNEGRVWEGEEEEVGKG